MVAQPFDISLTIEAERGRVHASNFVVPHYGADLTLTIDGVTETRKIGAPTTYEAQLEHVVQVLAGHAQPITAGQDSIANMTAILAIRAVAETEVA
jgi:predicted dehydrogenase